MSDNKWGNEEFSKNENDLLTSQVQENPLDVAEEMMTYLNHTFKPAAENILSRVKGQSERADFLNDAIGQAETIADESLAAMNSVNAPESAVEEDVHSTPSITAR